LTALMVCLSAKSTSASVVNRPKPNRIEVWASSSLATEWVKGRTVDEALTIKNTQIVEELSLPPVKIHCSVLAEDAIKAAIKDYQTKNGQAQASEQPAEQAQA